MKYKDGKTFFKAMTNGSFFDRNGATRGVCDKNSNHDPI